MAVVLCAKDYYKILGVSKKTNEADLKSAYRSLALKYHPDKVRLDLALIYLCYFSTFIVLFCRRTRINLNGRTKNLQRFLRPMTFYPILKNETYMTREHLVMMGNLNRAE